MIIKNATLNELPLIMLTEKQAFIPQLQEKEETFLQRINAARGTFLLFYTDFDEYMGYLSAEFIPAVPVCMEQISFNHLPEKDCKSDIIYISSFALDKKFRGNGNGKMAFSMAINHLENQPGTKRIVLLVNEIWNGARWIYQKAGFREINSFEDCFPPEHSLHKTAGILMEKKLYN